MAVGDESEEREEKSDPQENEKEEEIEEQMRGEERGEGLPTGRIKDNIQRARRMQKTHMPHTCRRGEGGGGGRRAKL